jgi:hypothetical protein
MGLMQRNKGKRFERLIAAKFRERWPDAIVRRASQAERADNPDVFVEGGPPVLSRLWMELTDARTPNVLGKLAQAEGDVCGWHEAREETGWRTSRRPRCPVVIWHRLGERTINVTARYWVVRMLDGDWSNEWLPCHEQVMTMSLDDFLSLLGESTKARAA